MKVINKYGNSIVNIIKDRTGVTLLEIIISMLILSLVMYSLVSLFVVSKKFVYHSGSRLIASQYAKIAFEEPDQIAVTADRYLVNSNCLYNTSNCLPVSYYQNGVFYNITYATSAVSNATTGATDLRKVIVNITWYEPQS